MDFRRARAPIALIMLLCLGIWAGSAFADGAVTAVTNAVTDTIPTDTTATSSTDTTPTDTTSTSGGGVTATTPVDTVTTPVATTSPPVAITVGPDQATASDPGTGANAVAPATASQTAAAAAAAAAKGANAKGAHKAKKQRDPSPRAAPVGSRPTRPAGGIVPRTHHASSHTKTTKTTKTPKTATTANATRSNVKVLHVTTKAKTPATTPTAHANGGRADAASNEQAPVSPAQAPVSPAQAPVSIPQARPSHHQDGGVGFDTPQGHLSISPTGFKLGGSERSIASVDGVLTAVLDTLAVLAALAAVIGAGALLSKIRRNRRDSRRRVRIAAAKPRTREQLYVEAKRQNIAGRSKMTKAQLERALYPPPPVRDRHVKRVNRFEALRGLRVPLLRGGSRGNGH